MSSPDRAPLIHGTLGPGHSHRADDRNCEADRAKADADSQEGGLVGFDDCHGGEARRSDATEADHERRADAAALQMGLTETKVAFGSAFSGQRVLAGLLDVLLEARLEREVEVDARPGGPGILVRE